MPGTPSRPTPRTLLFLTLGAVGAALFLVLIAVTDLVKPGAYDPVADAVSEAAIGAGGWLAVLNFVVSGVLVAVAGPAVGRVVSRWTGRLVTAAGVCLALAGVFVSDPVPVSEATWHGTVHNVVGTLSSVALVAACFTASGWRGAAWRWCSRTLGVAQPVLFLVALLWATDTTGLWQRVTNVLGFTWLIVLMVLALGWRGPRSPAGPA